MYLEQQPGLYYAELKFEFLKNPSFNVVDDFSKAECLILGPGMLSDSGLDKNESYPWKNLSHTKCIFLNKEYKNLGRKLKFINDQQFDHVFTVHHDYQKWNKECPNAKFHKVPFAFNPIVFRDYKLDKVIDVGFTGNLFNKGPYIGTTIMGENFNNVRERIFNKLEDDKLKGYNQFLGGGVYLRGTEYGRKINSSKVWICTPSAIDLVGTRFYEIMGCNTLLFAKNLEGIYDGLFEDGVHYVGFNDDLSDFGDKLTYYLNNEEERKKIALAGYHHVLEKHTWNNRVNSVYEILKGDMI